MGTEKKNFNSKINIFESEKFFEKTFHNSERSIHLDTNFTVNDEYNLAILVFGSAC